jgi:hypothetical protein
MKKLLLLSLCALAASQSMAQCNELFISEYVEGGGNDKAIEIYNPTSNPITLSNYRLVRYSNGSALGSDSLTLSGTILPHDVWVITNGQTTSTSTSPAVSPGLMALGDQWDGAYPAPTYMNGNDALALIKISPRTTVDVFGKIGEDPDTQIPNYTGFGWPDANMADWTKDHTLQRKATVMGGDMNGSDAFNPSVQYDSLPKDTWTGLGTHNCNCPLGINESAQSLKVSVFPNPAVSDGKFIVSAGEAIEEIEIFNTIGQVVRTVKGTNNEKQLSVPTQGLRAGLYFVRSTFSNDRSVVTKLNIK